MRQVMRSVAFLLIFVAGCGGCQNVRKSVVPTKIEPPPKEQPQASVENPPS
jgi:hypothetical protein